jgi:hypothetical protein
MSAQFAPRPDSAREGESYPTSSASTAPKTRIAGSPIDTGPTTEHLQQIDTARIAMKPLRRAAAWAAFDGWTLIFFGVITILFSLGFNIALLLGIALVYVGWHDVQAGKSLLRLESTSIDRLIQGQIILGVSLAIYGAWYLYRAMNDANPSGLDSSVLAQANLSGVADMARAVTAAIYVGVLAFAIAGPGVMILFYRSRRAKLAQYLANVPPWIIELQRKGVPV